MTEFKLSDGNKYEEQFIDNFNELYNETIKTLKKMGITQSKFEKYSKSLDKIILFPTGFYIQSLAYLQICSLRIGEFLSKKEQIKKGGKRNSGSKKVESKKNKTKKNKTKKNKTKKYGGVNIKYIYLFIPLFLENALSLCRPGMPCNTRSPTPNPVSNVPTPVPTPVPTTSFQTRFPTIKCDTPDHCIRMYTNSPTYPPNSLPIFEVSPPTRLPSQAPSQEPSQALIQELRPTQQPTPIVLPNPPSNQTINISIIESSNNNTSPIIIFSLIASCAITPIILLFLMKLIRSRFNTRIHIQLQEQELDVENPEGARGAEGAEGVGGVENLHEILNIEQIIIIENVGVNQENVGVNQVVCCICLENICEDEVDTYFGCNHDRNWCNDCTPFVHARTQDCCPWCRKVKISVMN